MWTEGAVFQECWLRFGDLEVVLDLLLKVRARGVGADVTSNSCQQRQGHNNDECLGVYTWLELVNECKNQTHRGCMLLPLGRVATRQLQ